MVRSCGRLRDDCVSPLTSRRFASLAMCALAARHSPLGRSNPANAGNAFLAKAHELVVPLLRMPTTDGVTGLLLLAWAEHGQNSESGFWVRLAVAPIILKYRTLS